MLKKIKEELNYVQKVKNELNKYINNAPDDKIRCSTCRGNYQYYIGDRYLRNDEREFVAKIVMKEYSKKMINHLKKFENALEVIDYYLENELLQNVYRTLHPAKQVLVEPVYQPIEEIVKEFEEIQYQGKQFLEDDKTSYYTLKGERVRSKSEKIIADELYRNGIPYKYELPIELKMWNKQVKIYPDFTVLNKRTGKRWIIEHLGMLDDESYYESSLQKLDTYEKNDILLGKNLIILHETSTIPLDTRTIMKYIKEYLI